MAGNKKPRKQMKPRKALLRPMTIGIDDAGKQAMKLIPHAEFEKLRMGIATEESWHTITARLNLGYIMATTHEWGIDLKPECKQALDAVVSVMERKNRTGVFGISGDESKLIGQVLNNCDDMEMELTRKELYACYQEVMKSAIL